MSGNYATYLGTYQVGGKMELDTTPGVGAVNGNISLVYAAAVAAPYSVPASSAAESVQWDASNQLNSSATISFGSSSSTLATGRLIFQGNSDNLGAVNLTSYGIIDMGSGEHRDGRLRQPVRGAVEQHKFHQG